MANEIYYYYLRNSENHPVGCVAIQETHDGKINRGVSLCSKKDHFNKNHARGLALARLNEAKESLFSKPFNQYYGNQPTMPAVANLPYEKYSCNVVPTDFEKRILTKPEEA